MVIHSDGGIGKGPDSEYAPGNEAQTNPSVFSLIVKEGILQSQQDIDEQVVKDWAIRVFESKKPITTPESGNDYGTTPFECQPAHGHHLILVASPDRNDTLSTISPEQWSHILVVVQDRLRWLYTKKGVSYVAVYADHDGTLCADDQMYPHLNMVSFRMLPPMIEKEIESHRKSQERRGECPLCLIIEDGTHESRRVLQTENFVAYCPWSPSYPFEFFIAPKKHAVSFTRMSQKEMEDLGLMLRATLGGLGVIHDGVSYSIAFHLSAERKSSRQIHWHIEVYPMTKKWSGMERGYGIHLNDVSPEDAACQLASACRKELGNMVGIG